MSFSGTGGRFVGLLLAACGLTLVGCGERQLSGSEAYRLATTLDTMVRLKKADQVEQARTLLDESLAAGKIGQDDYAALEEILEEAQAGDWSAAQGRADRLLEGQSEQPSNG